MCDVDDWHAEHPLDDENLAGDNLMDQLLEAENEDKRLILDSDIDEDHTCAPTRTSPISQDPQDEDVIAFKAIIAQRKGRYYQALDNARPAHRFAGVFCF